MVRDDAAKCEKEAEENGQILTDSDDTIRKKLIRVSYGWDDLISVGSSMMGKVRQFIDTYETNPMIPLQMVSKPLYDEGMRLKCIYPRKTFVGFALFTYDEKGTGTVPSGCSDKYKDTFAIIMKTKDTQYIFLYNRDGNYSGGYSAGLHKKK